MIGSFLYFLSPHWSPPWVHAFFSQVWWASLWLLHWTFYLINCLSPFFSRKASFSEVYVVLSCGRCSFISSFGLTFCVCLSVLGLSATSPCLKKVALCGRCPMGSVREHNAPWSPGRGAPRVSPVGLTHPPVVVGSWLLWGHWGAGVAPSWPAARPSHDCDRHADIGARLWEWELPWGGPCHPVLPPQCGTGAALEWRAGAVPQAVLGRDAQCCS